MLKSKKRFVSFMAAMAVCTGLLPMNSIKAYAEVNQGETTTIQILATTVYMESLKTMSMQLLLKQLED